MSRLGLMSSVRLCSIILASMLQAHSAETWSQDSVCRGAVSYRLSLELQILQLSAHASQRGSACNLHQTTSRFSLKTCVAFQQRLACTESLHMASTWDFKCSALFISSSAQRMAARPTVEPFGSISTGLDCCWSEATPIHEPAQGQYHTLLLCSNTSEHLLIRARETVPYCMEQPLVCFCNLTALMLGQVSPMVGKRWSSHMR